MDIVSLTYKVLSGQADDPEKTELSEWINQSDENRQEFEDIKLLWESSEPFKNAGQSDGGFEKIRLRLRRQMQKQRRRRIVVGSLILITIVLVLALVLKETWFTI